MKGLRPALAALVVLVPLYLWTASAGLPFGVGREHGEPYDLLARALLRGQLHLEEAPRPELFELPDPYLPGRNAHLRLHDASLYHGRYYLYFGIVPALVAFLPWRLLAGSDLPEPLAAAAFASGAFVFGALALRRLLADHLPSRPRLPFLALLVLGLTNGLLFVLRSPHVYEVAISAGACFLSASLWLFLGSGERRGLARLALAGLALGLAVGCRPNLIVVAPLLPLLLRSLPGEDTPRGRLRGALASALPFALCLLLLGLYNRARFGSWTEFGTTHQLVGISRISRLDPRAVLPSLDYLFLAPPDLKAEFPFLLPFHDWPFARRPFDGYFVDERTTGVLIHSPFLLILLAAPWILRRSALADQGLLRRRLLAFVAAGCLLPLATSFAFASVAMRFQADFVSLLVLPSLLLWLASPGAVPPARRRLLRATALALFGWSALAALLLSLTGASDDLRARNPELYAALARRSEPLRVLLGRLLDPEGRAVVRLRAAFPERLSADREAFLSWGTVDEHDVLWLTMPTPGVFSFSLDAAATRSAAPAAAGPATRGVRSAAGEFREVVIELDRVRRQLRIVVAGESPLVLAGRLAPLNVNRIWPGRGPRGHGALPLTPFSGVIIPEAMWLAGRPGLESLPAIAPVPALASESREDPPAGLLGQLRLVTGRPGADIFDGRGWRWIPAPGVDRLKLVRSLPPLPEHLGGWQPLLASGDSSRADVLLARAMPGERVAFELRRFDGGWRTVAEGRAVARGDGRAAIELDRSQGRLSVVVGGRDALSASVELLPLSGPRLLLGRLPDGLQLGP